MSSWLKRYRQLQLATCTQLANIYSVEKEMISIQRVTYTDIKLTSSTEQQRESSPYVFLLLLLLLLEEGVNKRVPSGERALCSLLVLTLSSTHFPFYVCRTNAGALET